MKKLIWFALIVICGAVFSFTGLYAATTDAAGTSEKPAAAEPSTTATPPADAVTQDPAGSQGMPMGGHGRHGMRGGMKHMRGGKDGGCGMMQMGGGGCGMMMGGCGMMMMGGGMNPASPLTLEEAKTRVENRLAWMHNPNLKLGNVTDQGATYEAEILTKDGSLVDKLLIHKNMGWMRSIY